MSSAASYKYLRRLKSLSSVARASLARFGFLLLTIWFYAATGATSTCAAHSEVAALRAMYVASLFVSSPLTSTPSLLGTRALLRNLSDSLEAGDSQSEFLPDLLSGSSQQAVGARRFVASGTEAEVRLQDDLLL